MILDILAEAARQRVAEAKKQKSLPELRKEAEALPKDRVGIFRKALSRPGLNFICEVKKASPSKGLIAPDFPYVDIARQYEAAGAAAISVLTEPTRFLGSDRYLEEIRKAVQTPLLRKDFTMDAYMIYQAKILGADAVLLIAALLSDSDLQEYRLAAESLGMDALVEAHDEEEVERALGSGARVLGVNNRNLKDFTVDIGNSLRLRPLVPKTIPFVAESGIRTRQQTAELEQAGVNGVLIGETLMRSPDMKAMLEQLRGDAK
ncbi:MAG: indole-3-glycerol phosphate synthase TrpC [Acidaminococcus sp.]|uniref:indole-3-glycerol phosphate synthase TrpC n=1 Tax=Acidaminococcus sp. TaxID=1872103 RepID=UPI0026E089CC|nr:indole-3-glycerol phosphate synthase TrpC [Acidaminococcus sp.]MDO5597683.1 indole-3-glycerol phosphate synthase TrpC [Acidaminococcus sp.]